MPRSNPPAWITPQGIDLAKYPIEPVLVQALAPDAKSFRTACVILQSMCHGGRNEAGVFLLGLLQHYRSNFARLEVIAQALAYFPTAAAAQALAAELRGVKGSNASRAYLRAVIRTLQRYPEEIAASLLEDLATDRRVGVRFRQRLKTFVQE